MADAGYSTVIRSASSPSRFSARMMPALWRTTLSSGNRLVMSAEKDLIAAGFSISRTAVSRPGLAVAASSRACRWRVQQ